MRELVEAIPIMAWVSSADGSVSYFNKQWNEATGLEQSGNENWMDALHPDDSQAMASQWNESLHSRVGGERECRVWNGSQSCFRWHLMRWQAVKIKTAGECGWIGISIDIHDRKTLAERFEAEVTGRIADVRRSLSQKQTLLQEVHHRVRNNLQIIASLLAVQMASLKDDALVAILRESERRISSMMMIHQLLYQGARVDRLDFAEYAQNLTLELMYVYDDSSNRVRTSVRAEKVLLGVDQAIPCGLILNELVTNSLKYAYPGEKSGEIVVEISETNDRFVVLTVSDQGVGFPESFLPDETTSFGLTLVQELAKQLDGELIMDGRDGAVFTVRFPKA